jgi:uncharacterized protein YbjT (DUF2867 family)
VRLVVGGTGKTGSRVVGRLRDLDIPVRVAARSAEPGFDWEDESTWAPVLDGVRGVYIVPLDSSFLTSAFVRRAVDVGVQRIVLLSARGVDVPGYYGDDNPATDSHLDGERAVRESGVTWTILRPGWYAQNFNEGFFLDQVRAGELRVAAGDGAAAFVDVDDIAAVAVAALTQDGHAEAIYDLSGPRALTFHDVAEEIGGGLRYVPLTEDEYLAELVSQGMPPQDAQLWSAALDPVRRGLEGVVSDGVSRALGRAPKDFRDYVKTAAWPD